MGNRACACEKTFAHCAGTCPLAGKDDNLEEDIVCDIFNSAGAIFEETLMDLSEPDRQLLLFSGGGNLVAVRWLFVLGADRHACDSNGTSALHTACRTGSLPIIKELLHQGIPLDVADSSGWTPLHIAICMGRREVVLSLLKACAPLLTHNNKGQTPLDMCSDTWTREVIQSFMEHLQKSPDEPWQYRKEGPPEEETGNELQYEPFFVPRSPAINEVLHREDFITLGMRIFNKRPGEGLAFLVASGCTDGCPIDISTFLRCEELDLAQIGDFLGETFSLAQMLRLEFINSVRLLGTSIVSCLAKVFSLLQIPPDLQKIDRLVHSVAQVWWRQHENHLEEMAMANGGKVDQPLSPCAGDMEELMDGPEEFSSLMLKQYLSNAETLYQIMFSVLMLHRSLYTGAGDFDRDSGEDLHICVSEWLEINRGLEVASSDALLEVLERTYRTVRNGLIPQFVIRYPGRQDDEIRAISPDFEPNSLTKSVSTREGWVWISGRSLASAVGTTQCAQISSIFSESLSSARRCNGAGDKLGGFVSSKQWDNSGGKDRAWLSLCYSLLLFSKSPGSNEIPFAFVHLRRVMVDEKRRNESNMISLVGNPECYEVERGTSERCCGNQNGKDVEKCCVVIVFLLPDGRWQEFDMPRLDIQVGDDTECEHWLDHLRAVCRPLTI